MKGWDLAAQPGTGGTLGQATWVGHTAQGQDHLPRTVALVAAESGRVVTAQWTQVERPLLLSSTLPGQLWQPSTRDLEKHWIARDLCLKMTPPDHKGTAVVGNQLNISRLCNWRRGSGPCGLGP